MELSELELSVSKVELSKLEGYIRNSEYVDSYSGKVTIIDPIFIQMTEICPTPLSLDNSNSDNSNSDNAVV